MTQTEKNLIINYKDQVAKKLMIEGEWTQRDFIHLIELIEEESGIKISLSTIKRIWALNLTNPPHPSTLNALVSVLGYEDWLAFKASQLNRVDVNAKKSDRINWFFLASLGLASIISIYVISKRVSKVVPAIPAIPAIPTDQGAVPAVPDTIVFDHDVSNDSVDSFSSNKPRTKPL